MIAALGAVTGFDDWAPTLLRDADPLMLQGRAHRGGARRARRQRACSRVRVTQRRLLGVHCAVGTGVALEEHDLVDGPRLALTARVERRDHRDAGRARGSRVRA